MERCKRICELLFSKQFRKNQKSSLQKQLNNEAKNQQRGVLRNIFDC